MIQLKVTSTGFLPDKAGMWHRLTRAADAAQLHRQLGRRHRRMRAADQAEAGGECW